MLLPRLNNNTGSRKGSNTMVNSKGSNNIINKKDNNNIISSKVILQMGNNNPKQLIRKYVNYESGILLKP